MALAIESGGSPPTKVARCVERFVCIEYRMAQLKEERTRYYEEKKTNGRKVQNIRPRTQTRGPNLITSPISLLISRRKESLQGRVVRVTSLRGKTHRIILHARNVANPIRGNVRLEMQIYATGVEKKGIM